MATVKFGLAMFNILGFMIFGYTTLLTIITIDETKQWTLFIFSSLFIGIKIYHAYQNARSKRIENDEKDIELKRHKRIDKKP